MNAVPTLPAKRRAHTLRTRRPRSRQHGISMFIVMIILLLTIVLVLGGLTVTRMNESIVGNQGDTQRAYGAAQALLDAAQRDIRLNGRNCNASVMGVPAGGTNGNFMVGGAPAPCTLRFPRDMNDYTQMVLSGAVTLGQCADPNTSYRGVCIPNGPTDPAFTSGKINNGGNLAANAQQLSNGAGYGDFVAALDGAGGAAAYGGDARAGGGAGGVPMATALGNGRYWVEIFPYNVMGSGLNPAGAAAVPDGTYPFIFRITAMAQGLKGDTASVLRSYYVPYPRK